MIAFLISLLLLPFVPQLQNPQDKYAEQLASVMKYLEQSKPVALDIQDPATLANPQSLSEAGPTTLPEGLEKKSPEIIQGLLLKNQLDAEDSALTESDSESNPAPTLSSLVLTGVLSVGKDRVAILNDGVNDYVVGKGSYVLGVLKVNSVGNQSVSMTDSRSGKENKQIELSLQEAALPGEGK